MDSKKILFWAPRALSILFILSISMFAMDVFGEGYKFPEILVAFFMHMVPSFVLIGITVIAWKWEKVGGLIFILVGVVFTIFFKTYREPISFLLISGPVFLVGVLFLLNGYKEKLKLKI